MAGRSSWGAGEQKKLCTSIETSMEEVSKTRVCSQHLETLGFLPWSPETPPNSRKLRPSKLYEQNNDSEPQPVSSTSSHESVNFRRAVSIQKSALLSALDLDFSGLVWHCGIQPRSFVTSSFSHPQPNIPSASALVSARGLSHPKPYFGSAEPNIPSASAMAFSHSQPNIPRDSDLASV